MPGTPEVRRSSVSTTGYADGLGRRAIRFDRELGSALECLALRPEFTPYERGLRAQADAIAAFDDERFVRVRAVERDGARLAVTSELIIGDRLSDIIEARTAGDGTVSGLDAAFGFLMQILPALSRLHAGEVVHGAIAPGRVILTGQTQVVIADAIYGSVLPRLHWSRRRLWTDLHIAAPRAAGVVRFDAAADVTQASLCGLIVTLGRAIDAADPIDALPVLVAEAVEVAQIRGGEALGESVRQFFAATLPLAGMRAEITADQAARQAAAIANDLGEDACQSALADFIRYEAPAAPEPVPRAANVLTFVAPSPTVDLVVDEPRLVEEPIAEPEEIVIPDVLFEAPVVAEDPIAVPVAAEPVADAPIVAEPVVAEAVFAEPAQAEPVTEPVLAAPVKEPVAAETVSEQVFEGATSQHAVLEEPVALNPIPGKVAYEEAPPPPLVRSAPVIDPFYDPSQYEPPPPPPVAAPVFVSPAFVPPPPPRPVPSVSAATAPGPVFPVAPVVPPTPAAPVISGPPVLKLKQERPAGYTPPRTEPVSLHEPLASYAPVRGETGGFPKKLAIAVVVITVVAIIGGKAYMQWESSSAAETPKAGASTSAPTKKVVPNAAPAPTTGVLSITSIPDGAKVLLNGTEAGKTPLRLDGLPPGRHTLTLSTGSTTVKRTVRVEAGKELVLDIPVFSGWVAIYAPIVLDVAEGGRGLGSTEQGRIMLAPGRHVLTVSNRQLGYSETHTVEIGAGEEARLNLTPTGTVNLNAQPWAEVWVEGTKVGETPIANLEVPLGTRDFIFRHPQFGERRITTTITTTPSALSVDFTKQQ